MNELVKEGQAALKDAPPLAILQWVENRIDRPVFASSMSQEDQVILHMIATERMKIDVFTLDTGRLFNETYDLIARSEKHFGVPIRVVFPDTKDVETLVATNGINLFYDGIEQRRRCCQVRKVNPLGRILRQSGGWVCGLREEQSVTRAGINAVEWDAANDLPKINPLASWTLRQVTDYLTKHDVPYNPLHDRGFVSIGCACCTRAIQPGDDPRSGRWWWEAPEQKECGLHLVNGRLVRRKSSEETT